MGRWKRCSKGRGSAPLQGRPVQEGALNPKAEAVKTPSGVPDHQGAKDQSIHPSSSPSPAGLIVEDRFQGRVATPFAILPIPRAFLNQGQTIAGPETKHGTPFLGGTDAFAPAFHRQTESDAGAVTKALRFGEARPRQVIDVAETKIPSCVNRWLGKRIPDPPNERVPTNSNRREKA